MRDGRLVLALKKQPVKKRAAYTVVFGGGNGVAAAQVKVTGRVR